MNLLAVNFHYFREANYPSGIYPTSRRDLEKQVDLLAGQYKFVSQEDIAGWVHEQVYPKGDYCVLTLDDGLKEQMAAFEFLWAKGIPAIFYVPTDPIHTQRVLPTHQLHFIRTQLQDRDIFDFLEKKSPIALYPFDEQLLENQYRYDDLPARKLKYYLNFVLVEKEKDTLIAQLFGSLVKDESAFAQALYMDEPALRKLSDAGALGSHGSAHLPLATRQPEVAEADISASMAYLESVCGRPVVSFSYPFGGATAVSPALGPMLERAKIQFAFTMNRGFNSAEQFKNPFFLNRVDTRDVAAFL